MSTCASARAALKRQVLSGAIPDAWSFFRSTATGCWFSVHRILGMQRVHSFHDVGNFEIQV